MFPAFQLSARTGLRVAAFVAALAAGGGARAAVPTVDAFVGLDLAALARIPVVSVSKRPESAWTTPAAVHVVTSSDIGRSAARSLPEALRFVPGLEVGALSPHRYVLTIRGFADEFANKVLVNVDGRSVYTPLFGGVYWDAVAIDPAEVEQIEVVRGPGGAAWGVNAVNGVVNIVTRHARKTVGSRVSAEAGPQGGAFSVRHGAAARHGWWRAYARIAHEAEGGQPGGGGAGDAWTHGRGGLRWDGGEPGAAQWMGQAEIYRGDADRRIASSADTIRSRGGHVLGRLELPLGGERSLRALAAVTHARRDSVAGPDRRNEANAEATFESSVGARTLVRAGAGARVTQQTTRTSLPTYTPDRRRFNVADTALEVRHQAVPDRLEGAVGTKLEYNDFTGWEVLPTVRAAWTPDSDVTVWGAYGRGARVPTISDHDSRSVFETADALRISEPNRSLPPETVDTFGVGLRWEPVPTLTLDTALFLSRYRDLRTRNVAVSAASLPALPTVRTFRGSGLAGEVSGAELSAAWQVRPGWRLMATASRLGFDLELERGVFDPAALTVGGQSPRHQASLRSRLDFGGSWQCNAAVRYVDSLPAYRVGSYIAVDLSLVRQLAPTRSVELVGENLTDPSRLEMRAAAGLPAGSEVPRRVALRFTWRN